jgi:hypothetical protein
MSRASVPLLGRLIEAGMKAVHLRWSPLRARAAVVLISSVLLAGKAPHVHPSRPQQPGFAHTASHLETIGHLSMYRIYGPHANAHQRTAPSYMLSLHASDPLGARLTQLVGGWRRAPPVQGPAPA